MDALVVFKKQEESLDCHLHAVSLLLLAIPCFDHDLPEYNQRIFIYFYNNRALINLATIVELFAIHVMYTDLCVSFVWLLWLGSFSTYTFCVSFVVLILQWTVANNCVFMKDFVQVFFCFHTLNRAKVLDVLCYVCRPLTLLASFDVKNCNTVHFC